MLRTLGAVRRTENIVSKGPDTEAVETDSRLLRSTSVTGNFDLCSLALLSDVGFPVAVFITVQALTCQRRSQWLIPSIHVMNVATAGIRKPSWLLGATIFIYRKPTEGKAL